MLKDIKEMIDYVKELSCLICEKEVFFYDFDSDTWYSRVHCRNVEFPEIISWLRENINPCFYDDERDYTYIVKYRSEQLPTQVWLRLNYGWGFFFEARRAE